MTTSEWKRLTPQHRMVLERYLSEVPVKLGAIAREFDLTVRLSTLKPGQSGMIARLGDSYIIKVNRHETRERQRFTLAHEIAHFLLHREIIDQSDSGIVDNVLYRSGAPEEMEYEANRLAADLLMPNAKVNSELEALGALVSEDVIESLAQLFQVSKVAMEIRLTTMAG